MDREQFLAQFHPLVGGKDNTSLCEFHPDCLHVTLKDASLLQEEALTALPKVSSFRLRRTHLTVYFGAPAQKEEVPIMANKNTDYSALAAQIIEKVGGKENIAAVTHCATRLRFNLKDNDKADLDSLKKLKDVLGAQQSGEELQIIIGNTVSELCNAVCTVGGFTPGKAIDENLDAAPANKKKKNIFKSAIASIVGCIFPAIPAMVGASLVQTVAIILNMIGVLSTDSSTYQMLYMAGSAGTYFFPLIIAYTSAVKFKATPSLAIALCSIMLYPDFISNVTNGVEMSILGLPVYAGSYSNMIFPPIMVVFVMSYVERFFNKHCPKSLSLMLPPLLTMLVMLPLELSCIAPIGLLLGDALSGCLLAFYQTFGFIAPAIFVAAYPFLVLTGMHYSTVPAGTSMMLTYGYDPIVFCSMFLYNFMQGAASLGVALKSKDSSIKGLATSCSISALVAGITEPALFGISFAYKTPLIASMIGGAVAGAYMGISHTGLYGAGGNGIFSLACFISSDPMTFVNGLISVGLGLVVTFVLTFILYKDKTSEVSA